MKKCPITSENRANESSQRFLFINILLRVSNKNFWHKRTLIQLKQKVIQPNKNTYYQRANIYIFYKRQWWHPYIDTEWCIYYRLVSLTRVLSRVSTLWIRFPFFVLWMAVKSLVSVNSTNFSTLQFYKQDNSLQSPLRNRKFIIHNSL